MKGLCHAIRLSVSYLFKTLFWIGKVQKKH